MTHPSNIAGVVNSAWVTFAHEIGHNLGGLHPFVSSGEKGTFGGVMDYPCDGTVANCIGQ